MEPAGHFPNLELVSSVLEVPSLIWAKPMLGSSVESSDLKVFSRTLRGLLDSSSWACFTTTSMTGCGKMFSPPRFLCHFWSWDVHAKSGFSSFSSHRSFVDFTSSKVNLQIFSIKAEIWLQKPTLPATLAWCWRCTSSLVLSFGIQPVVIRVNNTFISTRPNVLFHSEKGIKTHFKMAKTTTCKWQRQRKQSDFSPLYKFCFRFKAFRWVIPIILFQFLCAMSFYTIYTSHLRWNSSMRNCFYHTGRPRTESSISQYNLHSFKIHKLLKKFPKSPIRPSGSHFCSVSCGDMSRNARIGENGRNGN